MLLSVASITFSMKSKLTSTKTKFEDLSHVCTSHLASVCVKKRDGFKNVAIVLVLA